MHTCCFGASERVAYTRCTSAPSAEPLPAPAGVHAWSAPNHSDAQSRTHRFGACLAALHQVFFHPHARVGRIRCHIRARTGLTPATSAPGLGPPLPHLRRDWAHPCHIGTATGLALHFLPAAHLWPDVCRATCVGALRSPPAIQIAIQRRRPSGAARASECHRATMRTHSRSSAHPALIHSVVCVASLATPTWRV